MIVDLIKKLMGVTSSSHKQCCFAIKDNDSKDVQRPQKLKQRLRLNRMRRSVEAPVDWQEISTPSLHDHTTSSFKLSSPPTQERLIQIINCFPYPSSARSTPSSEQKAFNDAQHRRNFVDAFGKLVQVSVETMAITALPMDVWLKERLKKWVQLSGHEGSIVPATPHTLYKKQCGNCSESRAYEAISKDKHLIGFTPKYYNQLEKNEEHFIEIEDLLQQFSDPTKAAIMDIKVGTRTFLESEVSNSKKREDLYNKMVAIDPEEPTDEERNCCAITKLRYMQFRERESSTAQLGFRIEAAKSLEGTLEKNFKKVRTIDDVKATFIDFFGSERNTVRRKLIERLKAMKKAIEKSSFFQSHEVVGSSILIVYDHEKVGCWMIDFAKSSLLPPGRTLNHRSAWVPGNNEDGYLVGIDNLLKVLENLPELEDEKR